MISIDGGEWRGIDGLADELVTAMRSTMEGAVTAGALYFRDAVVRTLSGARSGRLYRVSRTGRLHQASAPGEAPAVLTGRLRQSITFSAAHWVGADTVQSEIGTIMVYARVLEYGGMTGAMRARFYLAPRPYFEPTIEREREAVAREMDHALQ